MARHRSIDTCIYQRKYQTINSVPELAKANCGPNIEK